MIKRYINKPEEISISFMELSKVWSLLLISATSWLVVDLFSLFQSIAESIRKDSKKGHARSGSNASSTTGHSRSGSTVSTTSQEVADINSNDQTLESSMKEIDILIFGV
jgi:hypothetical protein